MNARFLMPLIAGGLLLVLSGCATTSDDVSRRALAVNSGQGSGTLVQRQQYGEQSNIPDAATQRRMCQNPH